MPDEEFNVIPPALLNTPLNDVIAELVIVKVPVFNAPAPLKVKLFEPLMVDEALNVNELVSVVVTDDCRLPPFKFNIAPTPDPKAFVGDVIVSCPADNVVEPKNPLLFPPEMVSVPPPDLLIGAEPLILPLNVTVPAVFVTKSVPLLNEIGAAMLMLFAPVS